MLEGIALVNEQVHPAPPARTVLVQDQHDLSCDRVLAVVARESDVRVLCTTRTDEVMGMARREHPQLVVLDLSRSGIPESAALQELRGALAAAAILVVELTAATWAHAELFLAEAAAGPPRPTDVATLLATLPGWSPSGQDPEQATRAAGLSDVSAVRP
jgi:DNA-binding NarL/FixJ family response regulator